MITTAKTLQKLMCVTRTEVLNGNKEVEKHLQAGWKIVQISGSSQNADSFCWVLLEKPTVMND